MTEPRKVACAFSGQDSNRLPLHDPAAVFPGLRDSFREALDRLSFDLWSLVDNEPEADLNRTGNTRPAMLTAGVVAWRGWAPPPAPNQFWWQAIVSASIAL
jgi:[acyl-carrier-protein] S-malonyltransferase